MLSAINLLKRKLLQSSGAELGFRCGDEIKIIIIIFLSFVLKNKYIKKQLKP
jgi:hypothetical protein